MDHQDWPGWPDDAYPGGADGADLGDHDGGFDPLAHDRPGDPFATDEAGPAPDQPAHDDELTAAPGPAGEVYPDDDPFASGGHGEPAGEVYPDDDTAPAAAGDDDTAPAAAGDDDTAPAAAGDGSAPGLPGDGGPLADHPVGADPDADPHAGWADPAFPPSLELPDRPPPVDGFPWSDPQALGAGWSDPQALGAGPADPAGDAGDAGRYDLYHYADAGWPAAPPADLYDYAGDEHAPGTDAWPALLDSDDPATSALARWWAAGPG